MSFLREFTPDRNYEARIIRDYLNDDWTVRHGPFSGMRFAPVPPPTSIATSADAFLATMVIGCFESPLHNWINDAIAHGYDRILNLGCGEGYYAVGFALKSRNSTVYAYDIDQRAQENTAALARLNRIEEKVCVRGLSTFDELNHEVTTRTLIFCDIEGDEFDLLRPDVVPALSRVDLIVEMHVSPTLLRAGFYVVTGLKSCTTALNIRRSSRF